MKVTKISIFSAFSTTVCQFGLAGNLNWWKFFSESGLSTNYRTAILSSIPELSPRYSKRERKFRKQSARANENGPLQRWLSYNAHVYWE